MELKQGDYITDIPDEATFDRLVAIMQRCLMSAVPDATKYVSPWELNEGEGTLVWDDDSSIYWIGLPPEQLERHRVKRKVSIEDVLSLEKTKASEEEASEEEVPETPTEEISVGDCFTIDDMRSTMKVTKHKIYHCTSVYEDSIYFINDDGNEDYHSPIWFKKVEAPKFSVGEVITISDTGNCYITHPEASAFGLSNYHQCISPKKDTAYKITTILMYEGKLIYGLLGDDGKEYLSGDRYFSRVFNLPDENTSAEDITENKPVPQPLTAIIENPQWQHYNEQTETYSIKQEENIMNKTNQIVITVPTSPLAVTTTTTMFGVVVDATNEEGLHALLARINTEQDALKATNKTAKSSRITGQINKLGEARNKVVEMLDALPEE